jgi:hypothetical protein
MVHGNPIERIKNFRLYLIAAIPQIKKIDTVLVSKKERDNAMVWKLTFGFKKLPTCTKETIAEIQEFFAAIEAKEKGKEDNSNYS